MTNTDIAKLIDAGFMVLRTGIHLGGEIPVIKFKSKEHREWTLLKKDFKSKADLRRCMDELLKSPRMVEETSFAE